MILYIETNWIMGVATGRDRQMEPLLSVPNLRIALPSVCIMEALSSFEDEKKRRNNFKNELDRQINQLKRDLTSPSASALLSHLEQALNENANLLNDIEIRLRDVLIRLLIKGELIPLTQDVLIVSLATHEIEEPTDNLIWASIKNHASANPNEKKILHTGNSKDFDTPMMRTALANAGIERYFTTIEAFLGWFNAYPAADTES